jgi:hypothetical protein
MKLAPFDERRPGRKSGARQRARLCVGVALGRFRRPVLVEHDIVGKHALQGAARRAVVGMARIAEAWSIDPARDEGRDNALAAELPAMMG